MDGHHNDAFLLREETDHIVNLNRMALLTASDSSVKNEPLCPREQVKPSVIFALGAGGSRGHLELENVASKLGYAYLDIEKLIWEEIDADSEKGVAMVKMIKDGSSVHSEVTVKILHEAMKRSGNKNFLINGFPYNNETRQEFEATLKIEPLCALSFDCLEKDVELHLRINHQERDADADAESVRKKLAITLKTNYLVVDHYASTGKLHEIDANHTMDDVVEQLKMVFLSSVSKEKCSTRIICEKLKVVFVLGGPGGGKSTQCSKLASEIGYTHLSSGELLRRESKLGSDDGDIILKMINEGDIVPGEMVVKIMQRAMKESGGKKFLLDGFPRDEENRSIFESVTKIVPDLVLFFDCSEEERFLRLSKRKQGRADDDHATIKKRFEVFKVSTMPVIHHYDSMGLIRKIDAGQPVEVVFRKLLGHFVVTD